MKPFIVICACLWWMASCHPTDNAEPPIDPPVVEPPIEVGTPLLFAPEEMVTITVADETFTVDFSISKEHLQWVFSNPIFRMEYLEKTKEAYIKYYKKHNSFIPGFYDQATSCDAEYVRMEYTLAQECFSDLCDSETRKEILQSVVDKQRRKYETPYVYLSYSIHTGVFLMAVILVKERAHSVDFIDSETLQQALLFLNDFDYFTEDPMYYGRNFSDLIVDCAQNFLTDNK